MMTIYTNPAAITVAVALDTTVDEAKIWLTDMANVPPAGEQWAGVNRTTPDGDKIRLYRWEGDTFLSIQDTDPNSRKEVEFIGE